MLTNEIVGKEVIGSDGFKLGKITDTEFDERSWKVNSLEVNLEKEVAEEHELRRRFRKTKVLIHVDYVQAVGERIILKGAREDLLKLIGSLPPVSEDQRQKEDEHVQMPVQEHAAATETADTNKLAS